MKRPLLIVSVLMIATPACEADLGRLFYTPEQRHALEDARLRGRSTASTSAETQPLTYDGVVLRSDGRSTRWINGKPQAGGNFAITARGKALKPGQTLIDSQVFEAHGIRRTEQKETP